MNTINNKELYTALRKNGREKLTVLSKKLNEPVTTLFQRIRKSTAIQRFTVLLRYDELGYPCITHTIIKVNKNRKEELRKYLKTHSNVNTIYRINNGYDFIVEGIFRSMYDVEQFLDDIHEFEIQETTHYVLEEIQKEAFLMK